MIRDRRIHTIDLNYSPTARDVPTPFPRDPASIWRKVGVVEGVPHVSWLFKSGMSGEGFGYDVVRLHPNEVFQFHDLARVSLVGASGIAEVGVLPEHIIQPKGRESLLYCSGVYDQRAVENVIKAFVNTMRHNLLTLQKRPSSVEGKNREMETIVSQQLRLGNPVAWLYRNVVFSGTPKDTLVGGIPSSITVLFPVKDPKAPGPSGTSTKS